MNFLTLLPVLLSVLGRGKPNIEIPIKGIVDAIGSMTQQEREEPIEPVDVAAAQEKLTTAGYDPGPIDGFAGQTDARSGVGISEGQQPDADGLLGQQTWASLKRG